MKKTIPDSKARLSLERYLLQPVNQLKSYTENFTTLLDRLPGTSWDTEEQRNAVQTALEKARELLNRTQKKILEEDKIEKLRKTLKKVKQKYISNFNMDNHDNFVFAVVGSPVSGFEKEGSNARIHLFFYKDCLLLGIERARDIKITLQIKDLKKAKLDMKTEADSLEVAFTYDNQTYVIKLISLQEKLQLTQLISPLITPPVKKEEDGILWEGEYIIGGTFEALLSLLHSVEYWNIMRDPFFFNYRSFCTPEELLVKFENLFVDAIQSGQKEMALNVINNINYWMDNFWGDFAENTSRSDALHKFLTDVVEKEMSEIGVSLINKFNQCMKGRQRPLAASHPVSLRSVYKKGGENTLFAFQPVELARQLTLFEWDLIDQVKPSEFVDLAWMKADKNQKSPQIIQYINHFNMMTTWVCYEVLNRAAFEDRAEVIEYFITAARAAQTLLNFNTAMEIFCGLSSTPIIRLKKSWNHLFSTNSKAKQQWEALENDLKPSANFTNMRFALASSEPPYLPYFGVLLTDFTMSCEGNPKTHSNGMINFQRWLQNGKIYTLYQKFKLIGYNFDKIPAMLEYIKAQDTAPWTFTRLCKWSEEREPRGETASEKQEKDTFLSNIKDLSKSSLKKKNDFATIKPLNMVYQLFQKEPDSSQNFKPGQTCPIDEATPSKVIEKITDPTSPLNDQILPILSIPVHKVKCSSCKQSIIGNRYYCLNCKFDSCQTCSSTPHHPLHIILEVCFPVSKGRLPPQNFPVGSENTKPIVCQICQSPMKGPRRHCFHCDFTFCNSCPTSGRNIHAHDHMFMLVPQQNSSLPRGPKLYDIDYETSFSLWVYETMPEWTDATNLMSILEKRLKKPAPPESPDSVQQFENAWIVVQLKVYKFLLGWINHCWDRDFRNQATLIANAEGIAHTLISNFSSLSSQLLKRIDHLKRSPVSLEKPPPPLPVPKEKPSELMQTDPFVVAQQLILMDVEHFSKIRPKMFFSETDKIDASFTQAKKEMVLKSLSEVDIIKDQVDVFSFWITVCRHILNYNFSQTALGIYEGLDLFTSNSIAISLLNSPSISEWKTIQDHFVNKRFSSAPMGSWPIQLLLSSTRNPLNESYEVKVSDQSPNLLTQIEPSYKRIEGFYHFQEFYATQLPFKAEIPTQKLLRWYVGSSANSLQNSLESIREISRNSIETTPTKNSSLLHLSGWILLNSEEYFLLQSSQRPAELNCYTQDPQRTPSVPSLTIDLSQIKSAILEKKGQLQLKPKARNQTGFVIEIQDSPYSDREWEQQLSLSIPHSLSFVGEGGLTNSLSGMRSKFLSMGRTLSRGVIDLPATNPPMDDELAQALTPESSKDRGHKSMTSSTKEPPQSSPFEKPRRLSLSQSLNSSTPPPPKTTKSLTPVTKTFTPVLRKKSSNEQDKDPAQLSSSQPSSKRVTFSIKGLGKIFKKEKKKE